MSRLRVVIVDDERLARAGLDGVGQQLRGLAGAAQGIGRQHGLELALQFVAAGDATGGVNARQQRMDAAIDEALEDGGGSGGGLNAGR